MFLVSIRVIANFIFYNCWCGKLKVFIFEIRSNHYILLKVDVVQLNIVLFEIRFHIQFEIRIHTLDTILMLV